MQIKWFDVLVRETSRPIWGERPLFAKVLPGEAQQAGPQEEAKGVFGFLGGYGLALIHSQGRSGLA